VSVTAALAAQRRFVLYKLVPKPNGTDKVPIDPVSGNPTSAQDESAWMLPGVALGWAAAYGEGYGVGVALREPCGLFFIDIDGCIVDGAPSELAVKLVNDFAGCYVEYSPSGRGLHIFGSYVGEPPAHACKNIPLHIECYTSGRFMTTTGRTYRDGSALYDATAQLWAAAWAYFQPKTIEGADGAQGWTDDYDPLCTITGTPDERIAYLRKTKSFAAKLNSRKVTFEDLYTANEAKLSATWPADTHAKSGLPYDGSSVDQAFVNHLAFGFGNNCDAIEQFMLTTDCPLHRAKWDERPDYRRNTILKACAIPKTWTAKKRASVAPVAAAAPRLAAPLQAPTQSPPLVATTLVPAPPLTPVLSSMVMNGKDKYEATLDYIERTLESDGLLSFDEFRGAVMLQRGIVREPMTDTDMIEFRLTFERDKNFAAVGKELMRDACQLVAERRRYDSGIEWINAQTWDGVPRVDTFMSTHFGAEDTEYTRAVARYIWTGLAGRMFEPGCQLDMVVALQSKQGTGKSTGLKALAPDPEYFTDGLSLHEDDDNFKRLMRGKVIVEIAELAGLTKGDINVVKRAITRTTEKWIEKYQTKETSYERRCMLFASTNEQEFLPPDETGQRRWLPVVITEINRDLVIADRAQLWAEGAAIWRESGIAYSDAERLAAGRHRAHELGEVWQERIENWLTATPPSGQAPYLRPLTIAEVLEGAIRMQPAQQDAKAEKRAARALRMLGYVNKPMKLPGSTTAARRWTLDVPPPPPSP
jgi:Virulence-associated protein E